MDCATPDCFLEDQEKREVPMNWQVPEVLYLSILQPAKSASEKALNGSSKVPKNAFHRLAVRYARRSLKLSTKIHSEVYVWSRGSEVQEGANHAAVLLI